MIEPPETSEEFRIWREELGLTHDEAADALGLTKRTIYNYERTGPIPKTVGLACVAVARAAQREMERPEFFAKLVKEQYPRLGDHVLVLPFVIERAPTYSDLIEIKLSEEAQDWIEANTPSARFAIRVVVTPDNRKRHVPVINFEDQDQMLFFKVRWA